MKGFIQEKCIEFTHTDFLLLLHSYLFIMTNREEKIIGRRLKTSYVTTLASITLVLFVLGLLGVTIIFTRQLSDHVRENIGFTIFLQNSAGLSEITGLQQALEAMDAVKSTEYISKEQAAESLIEELGEDFVEFLGYNPLSSSVVARLNASHANPDSLAVFEAMIMKNSIVAEVDYQKDLVFLVNENIRRIGFGMLVFSALLIMIASALINNTIRLSVFSKRFLIKSMQLVGATQSFIRKPFLKKGLIQGLLSAIISNILLIICLFAIQNKVPDLMLFDDIKMLSALFLIVIFLGLIISWISTYFAVRKYLKIKTDSLYFY
jgi:cell division transport system permease protein